MPENPFAGFMDAVGVGVGPQTGGAARRPNAKNPFGDFLSTAAAPSSAALLERDMDRGAVEERPWEDVGPSLAKKYDVDPARYRQHYQLALERHKVADAEEPRDLYVLRHGVVGSSEAANFLLGREYLQARQRFEKGEATDRDPGLIAQYERLQELEARRAEEHPVLSAVPGLATMVAETVMSGGERGLAELVAGKAVKGLARLGVPGPVAKVSGFLAGKAAQTPAVPSLYAQRAVQNAQQSGGAPEDPANLGPAVAYGAAQNAVLGSMGQLAGKVPGKLPTRLPLSAATGLVEQQALDTTATFAHQIARDTYQQNLNLDTRYGTLGKLLNHEDGSVREALTQALTFAVFAGMHEAQAPRGTTAPGEPTPPSQPSSPDRVLNAAADVLNETARKGGGVKAGAAKLETVNERFQRLLREDPATAWDRAREIYQDEKLSERQRAYAEAIATQLPKPQAETQPAKVEPTPPQEVTPQTSSHEPTRSAGTPESQPEPASVLEGLSDQQVKDIGQFYGVKSRKQLEALAQTRPDVRRIIDHELGRLTETPTPPETAPEATEPRSEPQPIPEPAKEEIAPEAKPQEPQPYQGPERRSADQGAPGGRERRRAILDRLKAAGEKPAEAPPPQGPPPGVITDVLRDAGLEPRTSTNKAASEFGRFLDYQGEEPLTLSVQLTPGGALHLGFAFEAKGGGVHGTRSQMPRAAAVTLLRDLQKIAASAKGRGLDLQYDADPPRAALYEKGLAKAGYELVHSEPVPGGQPGDMAFRWRPAAPEAPRPAAPARPAPAPRAGVRPPPDPADPLVVAMAKVKDKRALGVLKRHLAGESFDDIGRSLGLTRQRVQQIQRQAIEEMGGDPAGFERAIAEQRAANVARLTAAGKTTSEADFTDPDVVAANLGRAVAEARDQAAYDSLISQYQKEADNVGGAERLSPERQAYYREAARSFAQRAGAAEGPGPAEEGAAPEVPEALGREAPPKKAPLPGSSLREAVIRSGGIDPSSAAFLAHFSSAKEAREYAPGLRNPKLFRKGGRALDELATELFNEGHLPEADVQTLVDFLKGGKESALVTGGEKGAEAKLAEHYDREQQEAEGRRGEIARDLFGRPLPKKAGGKKGQQTSLDDLLREAWTQKAREFADEHGLFIEEYSASGKFKADGNWYEVGRAEDGYPVRAVDGAGAETTGGDEDFSFGANAPAKEPATAPADAATRSRERLLAAGYSPDVIRQLEGVVEDLTPGGRPAPGLADFIGSFDPGGSPHAAEQRAIVDHLRTVAEARTGPPRSAGTLPGGKPALTMMAEMPRPGVGPGVAPPPPGGLPQPPPTGTARGGVPGNPGNLNQGPDRTFAHARVDVTPKREQVGLSPVAKAARKADPATWAQAENAVAQDPQLPEKLLAELSTRPRPLADVESTALLLHRVGLTHTFDRAAAAYLTGKANAEMRTAGAPTPEGLEVLRRGMDDALAARDRLDTLVSRAGTEMGRALRTFQLLAREDYSYAGLLQRAKAAKGGELTPEEETRVKELSDRVKRATEGLEKDNTPDNRIEDKKARQVVNDYVNQLREAQRPLAGRLWAHTREAFNFARAVQTSFDLSALFRQGGWVAFSHPVRTAKAVPDMLRSFASERAYDRAQDALDQRPATDRFRRAGGFVSDVATAQEENFAGRLTGRLAKVPVLGRLAGGVRASERAYAALLNRVRVDSFEALEHALARNGVATPQEAQALANFVNVATGRGKFVGQFETAAQLLSNVFFSPRYVASRFQLLAGQPFYQGTARTRTLIAKEYARYLIGVSTFYALASLQDDATVTFDPRNPDFGKVRTGRTRLDPLSGLSQTVVFPASVALGERANADTGKVKDIRGGGVKYGGRKVQDVVLSFLRSKLAPVPQALAEALTGETAVGEPTTPGASALRLVTPMSVPDVYEALKDQGLPRGAALALLAILGMGLQTYQPRKKVKPGGKALQPAG